MLLIKGTSIASALGVLELTRIGQLVTTETFHPFEILTVVAFIYFALTYPNALLTRFLERRYSHGFE
jgi:polar amino acid transport system permease protein